MRNDLLDPTDRLPEHEALVRYTEDHLAEAIRTRITRSREVLAKAKTERRARTPDEEQAVGRLNDEMDALELALRDRQMIDAKAIRPEIPANGGAPAPERATGMRWRDTKTGKEVRALRPQERLADTIEVGAEERELDLARYLRGLAMGDWSGAEREHRAMQVGTLSAGGNLVPAPLSAQLIDLARKQSVVVRLGAQTIPMTSTTLALARITGDPTAAWYGDEARTSGLTESDASFGRLTLNSHTLAILSRASVELAEDAPNFGDSLMRQIAAALALELDRAVLFGITEQGWDGLRNWLTGDATNSINEHSMGTNGAAITDYSPFVTAIQKVLEGNYAGPIEGLGLAYNPRTWAAVEGLVEATEGQPLRPPRSFEQLQKLVSTQLPITETQGSANTAATAFVGDFSQVALGVRTDITLEASREADDAFMRLHVLFRGYFRGDWGVLQPKFLTRIVGIIP